LIDYGLPNSLNIKGFIFVKKCTPSITRTILTITVKKKQASRQASKEEEEELCEIIKKKRERYDVCVCFSVEQFKMAYVRSALDQIIA